MACLDAPCAPLRSGGVSSAAAGHLARNVLGLAVRDVANDVDGEPIGSAALDRRWLADLAREWWASDRPHEVAHRDWLGTVGDVDAAKIADLVEDGDRRLLKILADRLMGSSQT